MTAGPIWDFNHGFGNCDYGYTWEQENWLLEYEPTNDQIAFWWQKIWEDEYFQSLLSNRWNQLRYTILSDENLELLIDNLILELGESIEEIVYLKNWLLERNAWIDNQLQILLGDSNGDDILNILDVIQTINIILEIDPYNYIVDMNFDTTINVLDLVQLVQIILNP